MITDHVIDWPYVVDKLLTAFIGACFWAGPVIYLMVKAKVNEVNSRAASIKADTAVRLAELDRKRDEERERKDMILAKKASLVISQLDANTRLTRENGEAVKKVAAAVEEVKNGPSNSTPNQEGRHA
jgi:hypothetical protein